jgi:Ser/Thr protein kinase RdoA (MazF antagonist)
LASSPERIGVALVSTILDRHFQISGRLERVATEKDDTFKLSAASGNWLVKVSPPSEAPGVVDLQTAAMRFLERAAPELPVQRVKLTVDGDDKLVVTTNGSDTRVLRVFEFVEGVAWAQANPDQVQLAKLGEMLGRVDSALEPFRHHADRRRCVWDLRHFNQLTELVEHTTSAEHRQLAEGIFRVFDSVIVPRLDDIETQVIHGDFSPHNVVVDPQSEEFVFGVIDFGDTVRSAVIFDPAVSMANLLGQTPEQPWLDACAFVAGYNQARPIQSSELPLLPVAALARLTLRALITNWRVERVPERRDYLLVHAADDWTNLERALAIPADDVVAQLRDSCHDQAR